MSKAKKKAPAEIIVKSVLEELKLEQTNTSNKKNGEETNQASAFGRAFMGAFDPNKTRVTQAGVPKKESSPDIPHGLIVGDENSDQSVELPSEIMEKFDIPEEVNSKKIEASDDADKTSVLADEPLSISEAESAVEEFSPKEPSPVEDSDKTSVAPEYKVTEILHRPAKKAEDNKTVIAGEKQKPQPEAEVKAAFSAPQRVSPYDAALSQAEGLKMAQSRINELERELERLRKENEILASAGEIAKNKNEELSVRIQNLERIKSELKEQSENELKIFRDGIHHKEAEIARLKEKIKDLESRLGNDLKKIRVRERELENRLELGRIEKAALLKSKDETILDYKRKIDELTNELESAQTKILNLNAKIESNQEQFGRTIRALRLALTNLEVNDNTTVTTGVTIKKAE